MSMNEEKTPKTIPATESDIKTKTPETAQEWSEAFLTKMMEKPDSCERFNFLNEMSSYIMRAPEGSVEFAIDTMAKLLEIHSPHCPAEHNTKNTTNT